MAKLTPDFIPHPDADFDEWQDNYVTHLSSPWPPPEEGAPAAAAPAQLLYKFLGIPDERYTELTDMQKLWKKDYARGGKETDRRSSEAQAKIATRKLYVKLIRSITAEYIHANRKASNEIKRALKLTVPDTEPSVVHGSHLATGAPSVTMKNMGGAIIDLRYRRITDENKNSVPKGYICELSYIILDKTDPAPTDPDAIVMTSKTSTKSRFQLKAGVPNQGKKLYGWGRWKHKINDAFDSPWTDLMQITIA